MASRADFDHDEWRRLVLLPWLSSAYVMAADANNDRELTKERNKSRKAIRKKTTEYGAANRLIAEVQQWGQDDVLEEILSEVRRARATDDQLYRDVLEDRIAGCCTVLPLLDERQRAEFTRWVNDIAIVTARAEKEDGVLVSEKEEAALQRIRTLVHS